MTFHGMLRPGDSAIQARLNRIAMAADNAGERGQPLEETTFAEVSFEVIEEFYGGGQSIRFGEGEQRSVGELAKSDFGTQVARCAYQCALHRDSCALIPIRGE